MLAGWLQAYLGPRLAELLHVGLNASPGFLGYGNASCALEAERHLIGDIQVLQRLQE